MNTKWDSQLFFLPSESAPESNFKSESVEDFKKRGGKVTKVPNTSLLVCLSSIDRIILHDLITDYLGRKKIHKTKLLQRLVRMVDKIQFRNITNLEMKFLKETMLILGFDLSVYPDYSYSLLEKNEHKERSKEISNKIYWLFSQGESLNSIQKQVKIEYNYDLDIAEIGLIVQKQTEEK